MTDAPALTATNPEHRAAILAASAKIRQNALGYVLAETAYLGASAIEEPMADEDRHPIAALQVLQHNWPMWNRTVRGFLKQAAEPELATAFDAAGDDLPALADVEARDLSEDEARSWIDRVRAAYTARLAVVTGAIPPES